ncbi:hypothetical protein HW561_19810 [Rhodobacteraceae bacterium B1Z28]|uniref:Uncharacterized protein n=1 Tax=Ruegeria haliotis TaxID=2747601 RepID=A0ABX2PV90_9RHOB|nr:hypothetical protein [Ruegeria haliotis]NVO58046.1 hypothetical protein [Ruegeria haliotis]
MPRPERTHLLAPEVIDQSQWWHTDVGWGLILPDDPSLSPAQKAGLQPSDPPALHRLLAAHGNAPVLRYAPDQEVNTLHRYYPDGREQKVSFQALNYGTGRGRLPRYLLIYGSPDVIPWSVQYNLGFSSFVGRLDLTGPALDADVDAICSNWARSAVDPDAMTIWSVVHNDTDITELMLNAVGAELGRTFRSDGDYTPTFLSRDQATVASLIQSLIDTPARFGGDNKPWPDRASERHCYYAFFMRSRLGHLVDQTHLPIDPATLLGTWQPDGAIWYAHACSSAGSNKKTDFLPYVSAGSDVAKILTDVAACGSMVAPFPRALLGAQKPLRAFIGHVEPTFNWTLMHSNTRQYLTRPIKEALYTGLYSGQPVGMALDACRRAGAAVTGALLAAKDEYIFGSENAHDLLRLQLTAHDWASLVLLGDPAVTLHGFGAQPAD